MTNNPYGHKSWSAAVRYWKRKPGRLVCARCGDTISRAPGRRPDSLDVGHIIGIAVAKQLGWSIPEMNEIRNTQPEHQRCSRRAGAVYRNDIRRQTAPLKTATTREW